MADREITAEGLLAKIKEAFREEAVDLIAREVRNKVQLWYAKLPADWFDNPEPFEDGTPRHAGARTFMQPLKSSWQYAAEQNGFTVFFKKYRTSEGVKSNWGLRLQQYGGWIRPVKRKALTIPLTADARGKRASTFSKYYNRNLFVVGAKKASGDPNKIGTLCWEDAAGELHAAYALRKSAYVKPLMERRGHDAIPSNEEIAGWAKEAFVNTLKFILTK